MANGHTETLTEVDRRSERPARRVRWIDWDSGFRGTGLAVGDRVVGDGGIPYTAEEVEKGETFGGPSESRRFERLGVGEAGDRLVLTLLRDGEEVEVEGRLVENRSTRDADGRRAFGEDGPAHSEKDGFDYSWASWYDRFQDLAETVLLGWDYTAGFDSRRYATQQAEHAERVAFLADNYPGAFATAVGDDFAAMTAILSGEPRELSEDDLEYRRLGEIRAAKVTAAADAAWEAFRGELGDDLLAEPLPLPNPFEEDVSAFVGKTVELPEIGDRDLVYETQRSWYKVGRDADGCYFLDRHGSAIRGLYAASSRYVEKVDPFMENRRVVFVGVVEPQATMVVDTVRNQTLLGLRVRPIAARVTVGGGEHRFFVDLRHPEGVDPGEPAPEDETFAGEAELLGVHRPALAEGLGPDGVLDTFFACLKVGDMETWKDCFADWRVRDSYYRGDDGRETSHQWVDRTWTTLNDRDAMSVWDRSREFLMREVYDLEVARLSPPRVVYDAGTQPEGMVDEELGRRVERVEATVDHVGLVDGDYRTFAGAQLHRRWTLERLDDGPWRITSAQPI